MYTIRVLNRMSIDAIHTFDRAHFNEFIITLSDLIKANRTLDVYQNGVLVATSDSGTLHQIRKIVK